MKRKIYKKWSFRTKTLLTILLQDRLFGIVVNTSDCHPRGPGFDSWLYPRNFSGSIGSGTGSTQSREDNWVATWMRSSKIQLRKLKLRLRDKRFAIHKAPCTAIWQQPLQSVLALRSCSATDLILNFNSIAGEEHSVFVRKLHLLYIFRFISISYNAHLRTRRHQSSVLGKCHSIPPFHFCLIHTFPYYVILLALCDCIARGNTSGVHFALLLTHWSFQIPGLLSFHEMFWPLADKRKLNSFYVKMFYDMDIPRVL